MATRWVVLSLLLLRGAGLGAPRRPAGLGPGSAPRGGLSPGWQALAQVTVLRRLLWKETGAAGPQQDMVSYILRIEGRPYTIHLQQHVFLPGDFRIYTYNEKGSLRSDSTHVKGGCHYQGYIDGFPTSAVTLSTCSGLRGLLQFENVTYGIEPLGYSPAFAHFVYRVSGEKMAGSLLSSSHPKTGPGGLTAEEMLNKARGDNEPLSAAALLPKYFKVYVVLDKALYNYMGSDTNTATQKIIQVFNLVNNMFNPLNVTVVLSSLELWTEENKISTAGEADDLLQRFSRWQQLYLTLQLYDVAYLLVYRDRAAFVGMTALGKACQRDAAGAVAVYQAAVTLESFSILLAQLLGHSLGIGYDDPRECHCPGHVCLMSPEALHFSGAKAFSNCSIRDFETFLKHDGGACLFSGPRLTGLSYRRAAVCGNGVVEPGEQCDCGAAKACLKDKCCTKTCRFKPGVQCTSGLCCHECQFKQKNSQCRPAADAQCDLAEFCNGSSASCPPNLYVQDGHDCEHGTGYCYKGRCQSPDLQCQQLYGRGSKNAPIACYEELNSQRDRFGHCGFQPRQGYKPCAWRDLRCGKLICTYPYSMPFPSDDAAVLYVQVREHLCVSLDYLKVSARLDPLLVPPGTKCGSGKVCINNTCHPLSVLGYDCDSAVQCHGHGVCNNRGHCHCHAGWKPPDCLEKGSRFGGSVHSRLQVVDRGLSPQWLLENPLVLGICLLLLVLAMAICLGLHWQGQQPPGTEGPAVEEGSNGRDPDMEPDPDTEPDPDMDTDPDLDTDTEPDPDTDPDLDTEPDPDMDTDPDLDTEPDPEPDPDTEPDPDPDPGLHHGC